MAFTKERPKPRLWVYVSLWLGFVIPTFFFLLSVAKFSNVQQQDYWISAFMRMDVTVIAVLGVCYVGRFLYSNELLKTPLRAFVYGFGILFILAELALQLFHDKLACVLLNAEEPCTATWLVAGLFQVAVLNAAVVAVSTFVLLAIVWVFERSTTLQKLSRELGVYGIYLAIVVLCGWIFLLLISPDQAPF